MEARRDECPRYPETTVLCVGLYGSASTWVYNVCRLLVSDRLGGDRVASCYADAPWTAPHPSLWSGPPLTAENWGGVVIKMHEGSAEASAAIFGGKANGVITVRDPRDAVCSVMRRFQWGFDHALTRVRASLDFIDSILQAPRVLVLRYEDLFVSRQETVQLIASHLELEIDPTGARDICEGLSREVIEASIRAFEQTDEKINRDDSGRLYNRDTHWHQRHFGDGAIGKWRRDLNRSQRTRIRKACWREITRLGYSGYGW